MKAFIKIVTDVLAYFIFVLVISLITAILVLARNSISAIEDIDILANNLYFEARNSSVEDRIAIAVTVLNRVDSKEYPNSIEEVIFQPNQFSWTSEYLYPAMNKEWKKCRVIAEMVYNNPDAFRSKDICFHYVSRLDYPKGHWTHNMSHKTKIGKHWFLCK
ncbi:MAG: cell wall hydrolase [Clostridium sp.]|nr:cell wall hydrolase [Clostridium sp.]